MDENAQNTFEVKPVYIGRDVVTGHKHHIDRLLLTREETAKALGISERTLYTMTKNGQIPVVRAGNLVRYSVEALKTWIRKNSENA